MNSFKYKIHQYSKLDSTNDYALCNRDKLVYGDVVVADTQTNGHGRFNRKWVSSNQNNLYFTIVLGDIDNPQYLPLYTAVVLTRLLDSIGIQAKIKWPNDILIDNKKVAGILVQSVLQNGKNYVVVGIGMNLFLSAEEKLEIAVPVTFLENFVRDVNKNKLLEELLNTFFSGLETLNKEGFLSIKNEYQIKSSLIGEQITVKCSQKEFVGKVIGFSDNGEMLLMDENHTFTINSGEVVKIL